jgi:hypothetical protein
MNFRKLSLILLAGSIIISMLFWMAGFPFFFFFLVIPIIPSLLRPREIRRCPEFGWETTGRERFCPYDAIPLKDFGDRERKDE